MAKGIKKQLETVLSNINYEISNCMRGDNLSVMVSDARTCGYRDAIQDVLSALDGLSPTTRFWPPKKEKREKTRNIKYDKVAFKYHYDKNGLPRITECLARIGDEILKGIAICGGSEAEVCKREGRKKAKLKCRIAFGRKCDSEEVRREEALDVLTSVFGPSYVESFPVGFLYKSQYMPVLGKEDKLLLDIAA